MSFILESYLSFDLSSFKIRDNYQMEGQVSWSRDERDLFAIRFALNTFMKEPRILLYYQDESQERMQSIQLERFPSNLGLGHRWYFVCPFTGRRCLKLHFIGGVFIHRSAVKALYRSQSIGKSGFNQVARSFENWCDLSDLMRRLEQPYFREYYKGKRTARAGRILRKVKKLKQEIEVI